MLIEPLFEHALRSPDDLAVIDERGRHTYKQLASMVAGLGLYLTMQTSKPTVGLMLPSGVGFFASFYGTLLAGKSAVLMNFLLGEREIAHMIKDSGIDTVLTIPQLAPKVANHGLNIIDLTQLP